MKLSFDDQVEEQSPIDKDEYIKSLEISIQLLQREIETLRKKLLENSTNKINSSDNNSFEFDLNELINKTNSKKELIEVLDKILESNKTILEWKLFRINHDDNFEVIEDDATNEKLVAEINDLVEDGVGDWILSNDDIKFAPSLIDSTENRQITNIFVPIISKGSQSILFFGKTSDEITDLSDEFKLSLKQLINSIALKLDSIISNQHLNEITKQLESHSNSKRSTNSELLNVALSELGQPIDIIGANLELMDKGIGDFNRRKEIISENLGFLKELKDRLVSLNIESQNSIAEINFVNLIEEITFITKNQLQRDGIFLKLKNEQDVIFSGDKKSVETLFTYLVLFSADIMPEGGNLFISLEDKKLLLKVKFYYESALITNTEFEKILNGKNVESFTQNTLNLIKKIVNLCIKNKISIELINDKKIGTTFSLSFKK